MKKILLLLMLAVLASAPVPAQALRMEAARGRECEMFPQVIDSFYVYNMNKAAGQWELATISIYENTGMRHDRLLMINMPGRVTNRIWEYFYDAAGNRYYELSTIWRQDQWYLHMKRDSEFDVNNRKQHQLTTNWRDNAWVFNSYFYNIFDEGRLVKVVNQGRNDDGSMFDLSWAENTYDINGRVESVKGINAATGNVTSITGYIYGPANRLEMMLSLVPAEGSYDGSVMLNSKRRLYYYDEYFLLREVLFEDWNGTEWEPASKFVYYYKIDKAAKVLICHNNHTICVSINALGAHLAHGDKLGACENEKDRGSETGKPEKVSSPFTVFPNPATDRITVRIDNADEVMTGTVHLTDFQGRTLRSYNVEGQTEITIPREGLKNGNYMIRLTTGQTWQTVVIFK